MLPGANVQCSSPVTRSLAISRGIASDSVILVYYYLAIDAFTLTFAITDL